MQYQLTYVLKGEPHVEKYPSRVEARNRVTALQLKHGGPQAVRFGIDAIRPSSPGFQRFEEAHKAFHQVAEKFSSFGASDSEPRWYYSSLIEKAFDGQEVKISSRADDWQLFSTRGNGLVAKALKGATEKVIKVVDTLGPRDVRRVMDWYGGEFNM